MLTEKAAKALAAAMGGTATYEMTLGWVVKWVSENGDIIIMDDTGVGSYRDEKSVAAGDPEKVISF
jgi:hypothetical protein